MMSKTVIPTGYAPLLDLYQTQTAIGFLKRNFEQKLCDALNLKRVSAPLFVEPSTGLNDDLNGVERPVAFDIKETGRVAQVVHSLAKWKRMALYKYGFKAGEGLYTDMNAIRRDEESGSDPAKLGRRVAELLTREKLPFRKKIGSPAQMLAPALHKVLPGRAMNRILRQYTLGGK